MYSKIEEGCAFTPDLNDEIVEKFNKKFFTQDSAILKVLCYNHSDLKFQHLPVREKVKETEINRKRNGCFLDTATSVDLQETSKIGGKVIKKSEGNISKENFKTSPFKKVIRCLFKLRLNYKGEGIDMIQKLVNLHMICLYGENNRKHITEKYK